MLEFNNKTFELTGEFREPNRGEYYMSLYHASPIVLHDEDDQLWTDQEYEKERVILREHHHHFVCECGDECPDRETCCE